MPPALRKTIRRKLLTWYDRNRRDLPWRQREGDPYAQWVAEIMLQQTRVDTVLPYYERFLKRFPTVQRLARARHDTVLKHWEGLGYYRRALLLHTGAQQIAQNGKAMPDCAAELMQVPGIGRYTASAIASIAFGERVAAVDGNVARVVARLFGVRDDVLAKPGLEAIQCLATELIPPGRPGDFNQAWMDLGTALCTPKSPHCQACPLKAQCVARAESLTDSIPRRDAKVKVKRQTHVVIALTWKRRTLMRQRPTGGLWSGLWEFPNREISSAAAADVAIEKMLDEHGLIGRGEAQKIGRVAHRLTHRELTFLVYRCAVRPARSQTIPAAARWVTGREVSALSVSTGHRRVFALLTEFPTEQ